VESFAATGEGGVKGLKGKYRGVVRLRVGEWRVLFSKEGDHLLIRAIRPRGDAH
jgi:mRNA-degrading endonuclease RelE of RelBE toxin-antitoxin system